MTDNALKIIKDELARIDEAKAKAFEPGRGVNHTLKNYAELANDTTNLTKALSVAVDCLQTMNHLEIQFKTEGGVYDPKLGCVKNETIFDVTTKPSEDALKTIANILSGGKDGK